MSYLYAKLHDSKGEVDISELTAEGLHAATYQAEKLLEEIKEAAYAKGGEDGEPS